MKPRLYINDLPDSVSREKEYVQTTPLCLCLLRMCELGSKACSYSLKIINRLNANRLHVNIDKTSYHRHHCAQCNGRYFSYSEDDIEVFRPGMEE